MTYERPSEDELRDRINNHLAWRGPTDTVVLLWRGYLSALMEWSLIEVATHERLMHLLPAIGMHELDEIAGGEPISPERKKEIDDYLAKRARS